MDYIEFRDKKYPIRTFDVRNVEQGVGGVYTIAEEDLEEALMEADDVEAMNIDCGIYFYIPVGYINLSAEEICAKHLDMPFEFIEEYD